MGGSTWGRWPVVPTATRSRWRGCRPTSSGAVSDVSAGTFGRLGLRDVRLVSHADGSPYQKA